MRARICGDPESVFAERVNDLFPSTDLGVRRKAQTILRRVSHPTGFSLLAALEAGSEAMTGTIEDRRRIALVVAGENLSRQLSFTMTEKFRKDPSYVSPRYAYQFWDSELIGVVSEVMEILGEGTSVSGASASGNLALLRGMELIRTGCADTCLVVAGMQELSAVELMAFANLGALGGYRPGADPSASNRPFDAAHDGFVLGDGAAAMVLDSPAALARRGARPLAYLQGGASALDGHHQTRPSREGEEFVMREALRRSNVEPRDIDLVSAHATGTPLGDETEAAAIGSVLGAKAEGPWVNATKSLLGHCLASAGLIEAVACVLQMRGGYAHANANLVRPITEDIRFVSRQRVPATIHYALNNSFGFGGINTALVLRSAGPPGAWPHTRRD